MKMPTRAFALPFLLLAGLLPGAARAQVPGHDFALLEVPSSTAAMAMGDAFDLSGEDSDGIFYNPAALARAEGFVLGLQRFRESGTQLTGSAAAEWWDGRVGIGVQAMEWGSSPTAAGAGGLTRILAGGALPTAEWAASAGYARPLFGASVGAVGKLLGRRDGPRREVAGALDVGATHGVGRLRLGLAVRNLAGELLGDGAGIVPDQVTLGAAGSGFVVGPFDLAGAARLTRRADGELDAGGGLEVAYWPVVGRTFIGRVGLQTDPYGADDVGFTFGAAFHGDDLVLEYAYRPVDLLGSGEGLHRLGLGWR